jgi:hypothetical protein
MNLLHTSYEPLMKLLHTSYELFRYFLLVSYIHLTNFLLSSNELLTYLLWASYLTQINYLWYHVRYLSTLLCKMVWVIDFIQLRSTPFKRRHYFGAKTSLSSFLVEKQLPPLKPDPINLIQIKSYFVLFKDVS